MRRAVRLVVLGIAMLLVWKAQPMEVWNAYQDMHRKAAITELKNHLDLYIKYNSGGRITLGSIGTAYTSASYLQGSDGTGWVPVDLKGSGTGLRALPLDPVNSGSFVYTYSTGDDLTYKLTTRFASTLYQKLAKEDNGTNPTLYEVGTNLLLNP